MSAAGAKNFILKALLEMIFITRAHRSENFWGSIPTKKSIPPDFFKSQKLITPQKLITLWLFSKVNYPHPNP